MPFLGERHWYRYSSDDGQDYKIQLVDYLAEAAGLELDDTLPLLPRSHTPRYVWLEATECTKTKRPARKKLIVQRKDLSKFTAGTRFKVGGIEMQVRGYCGETRRRLGTNYTANNSLCQ